MGQNYIQELFDCKTKGAKGCFEEHLSLAALHALQDVSMWPLVFQMAVSQLGVFILVSLDVNSLL